MSAFDVVRSQLRDRFPKHEVVPVLVNETVGRFLEKLALWARVGPVADDQPFDPASQRLPVSVEGLGKRSGGKQPIQV